MTDKMKILARKAIHWSSYLITAAAAFIGIVQLMLTQQTEVVKSQNSASEIKELKQKQSDLEKKVFDLGNNKVDHTDYLNVNEAYTDLTQRIKALEDKAEAKSSSSSSVSKTTKTK